jgi:hypothetical protein
MNIRYFALVYGAVFLLVGVAGFVPLLLTPSATPAATGLLFGLFPVNALHNLVHVAFGIWGLLAFRGFGAARVYARTVAVVYAVFVVMGLIPVLNTVWGLVPLYGHDIWLHAVLAAVAAWFGWKPVRAAV